MNQDKLVVFLLNFFLKRPREIETVALTQCRIQNVTLDFLSKQKLRRI